MIIYQAMAGRLYPKILDSILDVIDLYDPDVENKQIKEFHYPYL